MPGGGAGPLTGSVEVNIAIDACRNQFSPGVVNTDDKLRRQPLISRPTSEPRRASRALAMRSSSLHLETHLRASAAQSSWRRRGGTGMSRSTIVAAVARSWRFNCSSIAICRCSASAPGAIARECRARSSSRSSSMTTYRLDRSRRHAGGCGCGLPWLHRYAERR